MQPGEICIYHSPLTDPYKVTYIESSSEAATSKVWSSWHNREVWVLTKQLEATGELRVAEQQKEIKQFNKMILGVDTFPETKRRKKRK